VAVRATVKLLLPRRENLASEVLLKLSPAANHENKCGCQRMTLSRYH